MTDGKNWYLCDPAKNEACRKRSCHWLRVTPMPRGHGCMITTCREFARTDEDGQPVRVNILRTVNGFELEIAKDRRE